MKQFKKRTLALVLASVVTVVGAFGADNYKNSLMELNFEGTPEGAVNMVLQTKTAYRENINPIRKDSNTYVIMLPEVNSLAATPDLTKSNGSIESVDIRTMPYTNYGKGYVKIVIKTTDSSTKLSTQNKVFIPTSQPVTPAIPQRQIQPQQTGQTERNIQREYNQPQQREIDNYSNNTNNEAENEQEEVSVQNTEPKQEVKEFPKIETPLSQETKQLSKNENYEAFLLVMGILLSLIIIVFLYLKAKDKMIDIAGEKLDFDVSDDEEKPKKNNIKKITKTIKNLDTAYPKPGKKPSVKPIIPPAQPAPIKPVEDVNIVDLDELFQEHIAQNNEKESDNSEEENDALEEFLSGFSFNELEETAQEEAEEEAFDEELYTSILNDSNLKFTNEDIECINKLLKMEINDETIRNIKDYAVSNPIRTKSSSQEILEKFVTTYTISQNLTFTGEEIDALSKLINVELDMSFVTDLRTNPERTKEMQKEIERYHEQSKKPREILTLNVKDMLPDLSEALRQQGGKKIESAFKPSIVYTSEGFDVSILSLSDALPNLSEELHNESAYVSVPSTEIEYADNSYEFATLNISSELPDLNDALKNPDKYEEKPAEEVVVDEEALLKNISNVQFKPFYDGSEDFEDSSNDVLEIPDAEPEPIQEPVWDNIQEETTDITPAEEEELKEEVLPEPILEIIPEAELLIAEEKIEPLEEADKNEEIKEEKEEFIPAKLERKTTAVNTKRERGALSKELLEKIQEARKSKSRENASAFNHRKRVPNKTIETAVPKDIKCILEGVTYNIVSTTNFTDNSGCHLAKNENQYEVLGFVGDKLCKIKHYDSLKSEKIQARLSEKISEENLRYIVRIGNTKFIVDLVNNEIKYVMDLC